MNRGDVDRSVSKVCYVSFRVMTLDNSWEDGWPGICLKRSEVDRCHSYSEVDATGRWPQKCSSPGRRGRGKRVRERRS